MTMACPRCKNEFADDARAHPRMPSAIPPVCVSCLADDLGCHWVQCVPLDCEDGEPTRTLLVHVGDQVFDTEVDRALDDDELDKLVQEIMVNAEAETVEVSA